MPDSVQVPLPLLTNATCPDPFTMGPLISPSPAPCKRSGLPLVAAELNPLVRINLPASDWKVQKVPPLLSVSEPFTILSPLMFWRCGTWGSFEPAPMPNFMASTRRCCVKDEAPRR